MDIQSTSRSHQLNLDYIEDLLEDFQFRKLDIKRKFFNNNSSEKSWQGGNSSITQLSDIVNWLLANSVAPEVPVPAWKKHLMQVYVRGTVDSYFSGNREETQPVSGKSAKVPMEVIQKKLTPPEIKPRQKSRIHRGKTDKVDPPLVERKIRNEIAVRKIPNSTSEMNNKKNIPSKGSKLIRKTKANVPTQLKEKEKQHVKRIVDEEAKVDYLWKEVLSRNSFNVQQRMNYLQEQKPQNQPKEMRSISPLISPDVSISQRKFQQQDSSPISNFKIDKFLAKIRQVEVAPPPISPHSDACSSYTFPIGSRSSSPDEIDHRLQKIKKSLLDLESPSSSSNSTIYRILDDCFDSYEPGREEKSINNQVMSCCDSCSKSWQVLSSPDVERNNCDSNLSGISPLIDQNYPPREELSQLSYPFISSPRKSHKSVSPNMKELQRSILEADPKFKRVVDNIRRESEEVLRRSSQREEYYQYPYLDKSNAQYSGPCGNDTYFQTGAARNSSSLSTGMSELNLGSDFTDGYSDILIYPSTSDWDSM